MDWKSEAERLRFDEGLTWTEITAKMRKYFPDLNGQQVREKVRGYLRSTDRYKAERGIPVKVNPKEDKPKKIDVVQNFEPSTLDVNWTGYDKVRFAVVSDTHINSKYTQLTYLHRFYDECERQGIKHVYHAGDIDEGEQMRVGHQYECYRQGADDHVSEICRAYPKRNGIKTHFITGNHDASMMKRCGYNIGHAIAGKRNDMEYLGMDCAVVNLTPNCKLELRHPWDGTAYSISYKPQKMIDAMSGGEKPNLLFIGHYHKAEYIFYRNIHCFQAGCFCGQTPFMKGKGLSAHMGGWIIDIDVDKQGYIQKITPQFIPYYVSIKDDYNNHDYKDGVIVC